MGELAALKCRWDELVRRGSEAEAILEYSILEYYESVTPEALDSLEPGERSQLYGMLGIKVFVDKERDVRIETPLLIENESASAESTPPEAIVNAANAKPTIGGGAAGSIHRAAGPELDRECRPWPRYLPARR